MKYDEVIEYIHKIPKFIRPLGNANLGELLKKLGNPNNNLKYIHIAGTNGKGSTAAMICEILKCDGYKVGLFSSPFIEVFNERIQINSLNISDNDLCHYTEIVKDTMEREKLSVSEFAFICAVAFLYFSEKNCDYVVLETGMGGRLDATNIIEKCEVCVLTSISLDHTQFLGETIEEITLEKCGIIKQGAAVVSYPNEKLRKIIDNQANEMGANVVYAKTPKVTNDGFVYEDKEYKLSLKGAYQPYNAAVAIEAVNALKNRGVRVGDTAICEGLSSVRWPVRFEFIRENLVIDGAHNPDGIEALKKSLLGLGKKIILVMAMMEDKSVYECVNNISGIADYFIATQLDMDRCLKAEKLIEYSDTKGEVINNPIDATKKALDIADDNSVVCVCGSLYLAGCVKKDLKST